MYCSRPVLLCLEYDIAVSNLYPLRVQFYLTTSLCLLFCLAPLARAEISGDITGRGSVTDDRGRAVIKATDRRPKSAHREPTGC